VRGPEEPRTRQTGEDLAILLMLGSLVLFVVVYAILVGARSWG
jgi:hypothetical protein